MPKESAGRSRTPPPGRVDDAFLAVPRGRRTGSTGRRVREPASPNDGAPPRRCRGGAESGRMGQCQVSFKVAAEEPVVAVRLAPDSQVTFPEPSLTMYLYSKDVFAGRATVADQTG